MSHNLDPRILYKRRKYSFKYIQRYLSRGSRGFYPATLRVALHTKCSETRAPPLRDNLSRKAAAVRREGRVRHYSISFLKYSASLPPNKRRASVRSRRI